MGGGQSTEPWGGQRGLRWGGSPQRYYAAMWDHVYCVSSVCFCISCICSYFDEGISPVTIEKTAHVSQKSAILKRNILLATLVWSRLRSLWSSLCVLIALEQQLNGRVSCRDGSVSMAHQDWPSLRCRVCSPLTGSKILNLFTKLESSKTHESYTRTKAQDLFSHTPINAVR